MSSTSAPEGLISPPAPITKEERQWRSRRQTLLDILYAGEDGPLWPKGLKWDYGQETHCAMAVASRLMGERYQTQRFIESWLGLPLGASRTAFFHARSIGARSIGMLESIQPHHVARILEETFRQHPGEAGGYV